jgi:myo-inositol-1(or 4)-monophosphatase
MIDELQFAKNIAAGAVEILKSKYMMDAGIISSIGKDIKTDADLAIHNYLIENLNKTGIKVFSEESENLDFDLNEKQWIIDPIDGTLNFTRGFEMSAISIALWDAGKPLLGVVHHIMLDQVFYSSMNNGAWLGDKKISVSNVSNKNDAVIATGFSTGSNYSDKALNNFIIKIQNYKKVRMLGSASLMLAYVACGYFDIYKEDDIYIWDVAAGLSLVTEAGGRYLSIPTSSNIKFNIEATNLFIRD